MSQHLSFEIKVVPPFSLGLTAWALRRRPGNIVDRWDGNTFRRALVIQGRPIDVSVSQPGKLGSTLHVSIDGAESHAGLEPDITHVIETMLQTKMDCTDFHTMAAQDENLYHLSNKFRGLKPPRFPSVFEALANAIACQQLSLDVGIILLNRLAEAAGTAVTLQDTTVHAFPGPNDITRLTGEALRTMGWSRQKARALLELAHTITDGNVQVENCTGLSNKEVSEKLQKLRGVGRWTSEYVMLRGLGRLDVFPGDDVGAWRKLQGRFHLPGPLSYETVKKVTEPWYPYAGFVYLHLLLAGLADKGYLSDLLV